MARPSKRPNPKRRPPNRAPMEAPPLDFSPLMPFLHERLGADHPICQAADTGQVAAFMAAIRESGDTQVEHEIAGELEKVGTLQPRSAPPSDGTAP